MGRDEMGWYVDLSLPGKFRGVSLNVCMACSKFNFVNFGGAGKWIEDLDSARELESNEVVFSEFCSLRFCGVEGGLREIG